jgi:hypothetical protein
LAKRALEPTCFEWDADRRRAEESVAEIIRADRARIRAVVARARMLVPALLRDLDWELGGRE